MRLSEATLATLPAGVAKPAYSRSAVTPGIVHLGIGAFHRAHQAALTDSVLALDPSWGIVGSSLRSAATRDALAPQDGLYTLVENFGDDRKARVIGSVLDVIVAAEAPDRLLAAIAAPATRIVTLTITEKGYGHDPATGRLAVDRPDIQADLATPTTPHTAMGTLVAGLDRRRLAGVPAPTLLSCDNLPSNGAVLRRIVLDYAERVDPALARWIEAGVAFPSSMVDRIVPSTTDADRAIVAGLLGVEDAWPVMTEPFCQWVVEDRFALGRPAWEQAGVQFVAAVEPFEHMKLRLLNGAHSTIAYLSTVAGIVTVADAMAVPGMDRLLERVWQESGETLDLPAGTDQGSYVAALKRRFTNSALRHRTQQIAMDGSQKLPQRLLAPIRDRLARDQPIAALAVSVAAWMRHVRGRDETGAAMVLDDPMAATLTATAASAGSAEVLIRALAGIEPIFGRDLGQDARFLGPVTEAFKALDSQGTVAFLAAKT